MLMKISKPTKILEPYIKHYWYIENILSKEEQYIHRIIPCGLSELMFYLGQKPTVLDPKKGFSENVVLSGLQSEYFDIQISKHLSLFSIVFQPQGLMKFFSMPMNETFNQNVALKCIDKTLEKELFQKIQDAETFDKRVEHVNAHFIKLLTKNHANFEFQRMSHIVNVIKTSKGLIDVDSLSSEACLSRKQFERIFSKYIGSSPKQYLKTVRLQLSLHLRNLNSNKNLTQLAYDCGYYDQSHFINDFKTQTGYTPRKYFENNDSFSDFFTG